MVEGHQPGRFCSIGYYYRPEQLSTDLLLCAETLYVVGGLYGNRFALDAMMSAVRREETAAAGNVAVVFNGDFHWLDILPEDFAAIDATVAEHHAIQGNVEAELALGDTGAGCGCAYPDYVSDTVVERSNELMRRIKATAAAQPRVCQRLAALPKLGAAQVSARRIGIVHGDPESLAGWQFAVEQMPPEGETSQERIESYFRRAQVRIFAATHTGLPFMQAFTFDGSTHLVVNNGAAGLPCFRGTRFGVATRISSDPRPPEHGLYGCALDGVRVDAVRVEFDHAAWLERFRAVWPEGSPARELYERRLLDGPDFTLAEAMRSSEVLRNAP